MSKHVKTMDDVILYGINYILTLFQVNLAVIVSLFILLPRPIITHSNRTTNRKGGRRSGFVSKKLPLRFPAMYQSLIVSPISPLKPKMPWPRYPHHPNCCTCRFRADPTVGNTPPGAGSVLRGRAAAPWSSLGKHHMKTLRKKLGTSPQSIWLIRIQTALNMFKSKH